MKITNILLIALTLLCSTRAQDRLSTQGILHLTEISFCMDGCDQFYIEPDAGFEPSNVVEGSVWLLPYLGQHVLVSGPEIWCVECGAISVDELIVLDTGCSSDFNDDGRTDVLDVVVLVACILGTGSCTDCMDYNTDGNWDILDVIQVLCVFICVD